MGWSEQDEQLAKEIQSRVDLETKMLREQVAALTKELSECRNQYIGLQGMYEGLQKERDQLAASQTREAKLCALLEKADEALMWVNNCPRNFDRVHPTLVAIKQWKEQT